MKPITFDFDVITDAPPPKRRAPEPTEQPPRADAERERRHVSPPDQDERGRVAAQ